MTTEEIKAKIAKKERQIEELKIKLIKKKYSYPKYKELKIELPKIEQCDPAHFEALENQNTSTAQFYTNSTGCLKSCDTKTEPCKTS